MAIVEPNPLIASIDASCASGEIKIRQFVEGAQITLTRDGRSFTFVSVQQMRGLMELAKDAQAFINLMKPKQLTSSPWPELDLSRATRGL